MRHSLTNGPTVSIIVPELLLLLLRELGIIVTIARKLHNRNRLYSIHRLASGYSSIVKCIVVWLERSVGARPSTCAGVCIRDSPFFSFLVPPKDFIS